jgi:hypothetical protein
MTADTETLDSIRHRLQTLIEARLQGLSAQEQREYQQLIEREAALLKERHGARSDPAQT